MHGKWVSEEISMIERWGKYQNSFEFNPISRGLTTMQITYIGRVMVMGVALWSLATKFKLTPCSLDPWKSDIEVKGSKLRSCVLFGWSVEKHVSLRIIRREDSSYVINVIFVITTETINHLSLHCPIAVQIWQMLYSILDMNKAMPRTTLDLLKCWKRKGMKGSYTTIWNTIPTCIWKGI